jgi:hypothetical protein
MWNAKLKYHEYVLGALTILFAYLFSKNLFDMFKLLDILLYVQLVNFYAVPLAMYCVYYMKHRGKLAKAPAGDTA